MASEERVKVKIPSEDFKMKIIGRGGCNISTFEKELGVKVVIDDTPNTIFLVGDDKDRLTIAQNVMEKLIRDKKITPETIQQCKRILS